MKLEVGEKVGHLTLAARAGADKYRNALWMAVCDCGMVVVRSSLYLRKARDPSCGHVGVHGGGRHVEDLKGKRFGRLVALRHVDYSPYGGAIWECQCDCGNKHRVRAQSLKAGRTHSCGCLRREYRERERKKEAKKERERENMLTAVI